VFYLTTEAHWGARRKTLLFTAKSRYVAQGLAADCHQCPGLHQMAKEYSFISSPINLARLGGDMVFLQIFLRAPPWLPHKKAPYQDGALIETD
jgi:hypothetical protein